MALSAGVNDIYLSWTNLDVAFDDSGRQINPLTAHLTGKFAGVMKLFNRCGRQSLSLEPPCPTSIRRWPDRECQDRGISDGSAPDRLQSDRSISVIP